MKLSKGQCRIVGVILTEARIALTDRGMSVQAKYALLNEDSTPVAEAPRTNGFSEKVREAMTALVEALETDQMTLLFGEEAPVDDEESAVVSPQGVQTF